MEGRPINVLASPLEWGLGHSARIVPVIRACLDRGWNVIIASDGKSLAFLRRKFPDLAWEVLPFVKIRYSKKDSFIGSLIPQLPGIIRVVAKNRRQISQLVEQYKIDVIIGDHRYGLNHKGIPSIFVTSQVWLLAPPGWKFGEKLVYRIHKWVLRKFKFWWIADLPGDINYTGEQTHLPENQSRLRFIGPVSRFIGMTESIIPVSAPLEILAILSGPEPQRSILEEKVERIFKESNKPSMIVRGLPPPSDKPIVPKTEGNIIWMDHAEDPILAGIFIAAKKIICRPGITTLSDLAVFGKTALLIPTPGQTEQVDMGKRLAEKSYFGLVSQNDFCLDTVNSFVPENYKLFPIPDLEELNRSMDELFPD